MTPRVGLLATHLDGDLTGCGRYMTSLVSALCAEDLGVEIVPLVAGPLGPLSADAAVRDRVPADPAVRRALALTKPLSRACGVRASYLSLGAAAAAFAARRLRLDVLHDLTGLAPFPRKAQRWRQVITIHDLISQLPDSTNDAMDDLLQRRWLPRIARAADAIVAVSATTGDDVRRFLGVSADRIHVVSHGVDPRFQELPPDACAPALARLGLSPGFILFIGSASPRKNLTTLVRACRRLWATGDRTPLVVAGPARPEAVAGVGDDIAAGRIAWLGYVDECDLPALYNAAGVLAFPSSYEGFGLPALEAMRCGTPVLAGRGGALPEVVGDAGLLVDPLDEAAMAQALERLLDSEGAGLRRRGVERARAFTWSRAARETAAVYRRLAGAATR